MEDSEEIIAEGSIPNNSINLDEESKSFNTKRVLIIDEKWTLVKENIVGSPGHFFYLKKEMLLQWLNIQSFLELKNTTVK